MGDLNWTDDQWRKVNDAVTETFGKASVASAFLPLYGPLSAGTETVRNERLDISNPPTVRLNGDHGEANQKLVTLTVKVELSGEQVADETLSNAILAFRRAANVLAQQEDQIVFQGLDQTATPPANVYAGKYPEKVTGLTAAAFPLPPFNVPGLNTAGAVIVTKVAEAISRLESDMHAGPFACVLGTELFVAVQEPTFTLILPADRIVPLLNGPLLRSSRVAPHQGLVVSLGANAIDIVVGTAPTVQFLQRKEDARYLFRVYTRFALRIRQTDPNAPVILLTRT